MSPLYIQEAANSLTASQQLLIADSKLKRASQEETTLLQNGGAHEGRPRADSDQAFRPRQDSTGQNTYNAGSSFSKMRSLLEQQMGISRYMFTHYWSIVGRKIYVVALLLLSTTATVISHDC